MKSPKYCRFSNPSYARVAELIVGVGRSSLELPFNDLETIRKKLRKPLKLGLQLIKTGFLYNKNRSIKHPMNVFYQILL